MFSGLNENLLFVSANGYFNFIIFALVTNDGRDDGDDGNVHDDDVPFPNRRNRRGDDGVGDGAGLRTANQWMTAQ